MQQNEKHRCLSWWKTSICGIKKIEFSPVMKYDNSRSHTYCNKSRYDDGGGGGGGGSTRWSNMFVNMMREAQPYFRAHRGGIFVLVVSAEVIQGHNFDAILKVIVFFLSKIKPWYIVFLDK